MSFSDSSIAGLAIIYGSALSPKPPFTSTRPRLRIASLLMIAVVVALGTPTYTFVKISTFLAGFVFFGDPVISRAAKLPNRKAHTPKQLKARK
jgi:hypothetical protein